MRALCFFSLFFLDVKLYYNNRDVVSAASHESPVTQLHTRLVHIAVKLREGISDDPNSHSIAHLVPDPIAGKYHKLVSGGDVHPAVVGDIRDHRLEHNITEGPRHPQDPLEAPVLRDVPAGRCDAAVLLLREGLVVHREPYSSAASAHNSAGVPDVRDVEDALLAGQQASQGCGPLQHLRHKLSTRSLVGLVVRPAERSFHATFVVPLVIEEAYRELNGEDACRGLCVLGAAVAVVHTNEVVLAVAEQVSVKSAAVLHSGAAPLRVCDPNGDDRADLVGGAPQPGRPQGQVEQVALDVHVEVGTRLVRSGKRGGQRGKPVVRHVAHAQGPAREPPRWHGAQPVDREVQDLQPRQLALRQLGEPQPREDRLDNARGQGGQRRRKGVEPGVQGLQLPQLPQRRQLLQPVPRDVEAGKHLCRQ